MNLDKLKDAVEKVPITFFLVLYLIYLGYDYYLFENDEFSPLASKRKEIAAVKGTNARLQLAIKQANEFSKTVDGKQMELKQLAQSLQEMKATVSETLDIPDFMKMTITEAKKVGLTVLSLKPSEFMTKEFYSEQSFILSFRGVYAQLLIFLERLSNVQKIVRVDQFSIKPLASNTPRFVEIEGKVELKTYKYIDTQADTLGKDDSPTNERVLAGKPSPGVIQDPSIKGRGGP